MKTIMGSIFPHIGVGAVLALIILLGASGLVIWRLIRVPNVGLYQVGSRQLVDEYAGGGGIVFPRQQLDISYPLAERVLAVDVKAGDLVVPNQPLLQLDPTQINAQISQAANDVAAAQAYLNSVSDLGNPITIAQAQQAYELAQNRYNALVAQASSPTLNKGNLISPMRGVVTTVNINPNEVFAPNTILLTIMDQSTVIVHAKIPLSNLGQVSLGLPAVITPSALPDVNFQGTVISVIPQADPQTDTFEVQVEVNNPQQMLLPGMSAFVRIQGKSQGFVLPRGSVLNPDQDPIVFVVRHQHAYMQRVHVVGRSVDKIFVDAGVSPHETLVLVGIDQLSDGQQVNVTTLER
jgi:RND family efflux transporter MFP subunit